MVPRLALLVVGLTLGVTTGCTTEVAQTATLGPTGPAGALDCKSAGELRLPTDGAFGDGTEPPSPLVGSGYAASEGPGLHITARDGFRVYLNGELVVESRATREAMFVPLSLLPGENALSVVVSAKDGTPAALVELDELEKNHVSDTSWKASTDPESGFAEPGFDDTSWPAATDFGAAGALPGCDPADPFPESDAHWIGPARGSGGTAVLRKVIRIAPIGFGEGAMGGYGATPTLVSTWDELVILAADRDTPAVILLAEGEHDFQDALRDQPACPSVCTTDTTKIRYGVLTGEDTCAEALVTRTRNERLLELGSNKTLVGLGRGALVRGVSFELSETENTIVRNIAVCDVNPELFEAGDAFTLEASSRIWLDHVTTKWISDDFVDADTGTNGVTFSWMHFDGVSEAACRGAHTQAAGLVASSATFHHCFFDHVESHSPRVAEANARAHLFDNLFADNGSYAVASVCGAEVLMEANAFQRVRTPTTRDTCADGTELGRIHAPAGSNYYGEDVGAHGGEGTGGTEPRDDVPRPLYSYDIEPPEDELPTVRSRAGAGGPWSLPLTLD